MVHNNKYANSDIIVDVKGSVFDAIQDDKQHEKKKNVTFISETEVEKGQVSEQHWMRAQAAKVLRALCKFKVHSHDEVTISTAKDSRLLNAFNLSNIWTCRYFSFGADEIVA